MKRDFIGNEVSVGDHIFYNITGRYSESRLCVVLGFTIDGCVTARVVKTTRTESVGVETVVRSAFVKVDAKEHLDKISGT
jgi:hypothetical protein